MNKFQLKSGAIVEFNLASIEQALALFRAIVFECKNAGLELTMNEDTKLGDLLLKNSPAFLNVIGSELVLEAVKGCCDKVLYNKQRFSMELFEDEKARGDFFGLMVLVALENLCPFFPEARTVFSIILSQFVK